MLVAGRLNKQHYSNPQTAKRRQPLLVHFLGDFFDLNWWQGLVGLTKKRHPRSLETEFFCSQTSVGFISLGGDVLESGCDFMGWISTPKSKVGSNVFWSFVPENKQIFVHWVVSRGFFGGKMSVHPKKEMKRIQCKATCWVSRGSHWTMDIIDHVSENRGAEKDILHQIFQCLNCWSWESKGPTPPMKPDPRVSENRHDP